jgi:retron-type reverse transcriptase
MWPIDSVEHLLTFCMVTMVVIFPRLLDQRRKRQARRDAAREIYRRSQAARVGSSNLPTRAVRTPPSPPPPPVTLDLDAGLFAPISEADAKRQSAGGALLRNLGATGLSRIIPPASDPRTLLIDRGMVGHGLITPEQLVEIHRVGEAFEKVRGDAAAIERRVRQAAGEAVRLDKEARERRKAEKRAAAEKRRQTHARGVAHRRATDVVFLGRGVSRGLADRASEVPKLEAAGLPVLATPADVATALGLTVGRLRWLAFHSDAATVSHYVRFTVPKRSGGVRQLSAPHESLAEAQRWVLEQVLSRVPTHGAAHGFVPGRSTVTNATPHVGRACVVNADLTDFFPSVTFPRVAGLFRQLGYSPAVATVLGLLCTESPRRTVVYAGKPFHVASGPRGLPQGACTSPAISNLVSRRMDSRLSGIASKLGWTYTRYADDLTFSGPDGNVGYLLARVRHIAADEGFRVNEAKTRVQRPSTAQMVTGIVVNERPGVPRATVRRLRAILHRARTDGLAAQNLENRPDFEAWLRGMVAYVSMVNAEQGRGLYEALAQAAG